MAIRTKKLILELQADRRLKGTCPNCSEDFRLADAFLFANSEQPPENALAAIADAKQALLEKRLEIKNNLKG